MVVSGPLRRILGVTMAFVAIGIQLQADDFWQQKPYQKWSKAETEKMLTDSPWTRHMTLDAVQMNMSGIATSSMGVTGVGAVTQNREAEHSEHPTLTYTAQVRSARPIREAVVRQRQFQENYDGMGAEQRSALDAKTNAYLAQPQDEIVIYVTYKSNVNNYVDLMRRYWTEQSYDLLKNSVVLSFGRQRLAPTGYAAINGAFQFNFPRPATLPLDGSMVLEFLHPGVGFIGQERVLIEFKIKPMILASSPVI